MRSDYILFTHLPSKKWKHFEDNAEQLIRILSDSCGILVIFNDDGWLSLLNTVGTDFNPVKLSKEFQNIENLEKRLDAIIAQFPFAKEGNLSRIRLITAANLYPIVNNLRGNKPGNEAARLRRFLVSEEPGVFYDTAKVVESLVRVRHIGSGLPVIRVDWDALFNNSTLKRLLRYSLKSVIECFEVYAKEPLVHSYMLSGEYDQPITDDISKWRLSDYNVAFATRIFPALIPTETSVNELNKRVSENDNLGDFRDCELIDVIDNFKKPVNSITFEDLEEWGMFDPEVVQAFYGISNTENWEGIAELGAHPYISVISGSLLVLNDGAILDLPPFSNFRRNVMWIDDHLKYLLHQSLGHFRRLKLNLGTETKPDMFNARIKGASVYKDRVLAGQGNLRPYTFGVYIPTLFWGVIMDSWIQPRTILKPPVIPELNPEAGHFTVYLGRALRRGTFPSEERNALRNELYEMAIKRAEILRSRWLSLKGENGMSFAARWVSGDREAVQDVLHQKMREQCVDLDWIGWGLLGHGKTRINEITDMSVNVQKGLQILVDDAITYVDWALEWPSFVRSIRAVRSSSLLLDASYEPKNISG